MPRLRPLLALLLMLLALPARAQTPPPAPVAVSPDGLITHLQSPNLQSPPLQSPSPLTPNPLTPNSLSPEPGFPVLANTTGGTYRGGQALHTLVGNINADPQLEIIVTGLAQGPLYACNHDGTPVPGWPAYHYNRAFYPALGQLDGQTSALEVFSGQFIYRLPQTPPPDLLAFDAAAALLPGWPRPAAEDFSFPATLIDVDGDGLDEIFAYEGEGDFQLHAYRASGDPIPGWPVPAMDSTLAAGDLDGDGDFEFLAADELSSHGGNLVAYHHDGAPVAGFSVHIEPYAHHVPAIGDVDGDGSPEVIITTQIENHPEGGLLVISAGGQIERTLYPIYLSNVWQSFAAAPALADLTGDGVPEIVAASARVLYAWRGDGAPLPGFPAVWGDGSYTDILNVAPVVGDVTGEGLCPSLKASTECLPGDGAPDILLATHTYYFTSGEVYLFDNQGSLHPDFPLTLPIGAAPVPAIADLDRDGRNEIIVTGDYWNGYPGEYPKVWVYDLGGANHGNIEWGQMGGGPRHWGIYPAPPDEPGVELVLRAPGVYGSPAGAAFSIPLSYASLGANTAASLTLTATMGVSLTYVGDTLGVTPEIHGQTLVWRLPLACYGYVRSFRLVVAPPPGAAIGERFQLTLQLASRLPDLTPADNAASVELLVARQVFAPLIQRAP